MPQPSRRKRTRRKRNEIKSDSRRVRKHGGQSFSELSPRSGPAIIDLSDSHREARRTTGHSGAVPHPAMFRLHFARFRSGKSRPFRHDSLEISQKPPAAQFLRKGSESRLMTVGRRLNTNTKSYDHENPAILYPRAIHHVSIQLQ